ncbi:MAG: hypothetical protein NTV21_08505 [Planctomycetota bacterium]|nr:hypothetical protein [Planctomycetota bacterium]
MARPRTPPERGSARYALLPLRNLSDDAEASDALFARMRGELERRGASFVPQADLERQLRSRRIRYTDSLSAADLRALSDATGADFVLAGTLIDYAPGLEPRVALALRALDTRSGSRAGSSIVTLRGADFEGLLGLGRIENESELSALAVECLLSSFDEGALPHAIAPQPQLRERRPPPDGGSEMLGAAWYSSSGVEIVEPGELRAALVSLRVRSMEFVDRALLAELGRRVGTRWFALGTVERFGEEAPVGNQLFPEVEATVELFDVENARVVASAGARRRGDRYQGLLGLGAVNNPLELAHRVARELVAALGG